MRNITLSIGNHNLIATLVDNSSADALLELLEDGPMTIKMNDYARMEKVGSFNKTLPRNDEPITTEAGDLILYMGNQFVIYYATNTWDLTRLGKIQNVTSKELREILGSGNVEVTLSK